MRMMQEYRGEYPSLWTAIESAVPNIGCVLQTLNEWVKRDAVGTGATAVAHYTVERLIR
jgi:transposase